MHIAIDCRSILDPGGKGELAGIGHYTHFLARHLLRLDDENRYTLFFGGKASRLLIAETLGASRNAKSEVIPLSRYKRYLPYAYSHHLVAGAFAKAGADVFHAPTGSLPLGYKGKSVVTVHDLAIYLKPEWFPGGQFFSRRLVVPSSLRRAARVIAVSHSTARDVQRIFAVPERKIRVIPEGVELLPPHEEGLEREPVLKRLGLEKPYLLFLGTIEPRKNVDGLVRAYASLAERFPRLVEGVELVIAGTVGWKAEAVLKDIEAANRRFGAKGPRIRLLGYVGAEDKVPLMAHALAFVFPSRYEGFGLPILEAMSLGVPVISSNVSSIPEIAGGGAALLVDPLRHEEIALAMKHLIEDPMKRAALGRRGLERSAEYRWDRTAGETLEVYEEAARGAESPVPRGDFASVETLADVLRH